MEITPASTNALINRCEDENRSVTFCLTNSCCPGGSVTWSLEPTVPDGAGISGSGNCATVTIGDVETNYTIKAVCSLKTNCYGSATLNVTRDCDCTHHYTNSIDGWLGEAGLSSTNTWLYSMTNKCQQILVWQCTNGIIQLSLNDVLVGYCPYTNSFAQNQYFLCQCGSVFMQARFIVVNASTGEMKDQKWVCPALQPAQCFIKPLPIDENEPFLGPWTSRDCSQCETNYPTICP